MIVLDTVSELEQIEKGCVLTIGNFDGVHLGHQEILAAAGEAADKRRAALVAMTFEPHPVAILFPERAPGVLTPLELKTHLLAQSGVQRRPSAQFWRISSWLPHSPTARPAA